MPASVPPSANAPALRSPAATHKVDDLEPVSTLNSRRRPLGPAHDLSVTLHRDAILLHLQRHNERFQRGCLRIEVNRARLSVEDDLHAQRVSAELLARTVAAFTTQRAAASRAGRAKAPPGTHSRPDDWPPSATGWPRHADHRCGYRWK